MPLMTLSLTVSSVIVLYVVMLSVAFFIVMLSFIRLSFIRLSVIRLSVIRLSVVMLSIVLPSSLVRYGNNYVRKKFYNTSFDISRNWHPASTCRFKNKKFRIKTDKRSKYQNLRFFPKLKKMRFFRKKTFFDDFVTVVAKMSAWLVFGKYLKVSFVAIGHLFPADGDAK